MVLPRVPSMAHEAWQACTRFQIHAAFAGSSNHCRKRLLLLVHHLSGRSQRGSWCRLLCPSMGLLRYSSDQESQLWCFYSHDCAADVWHQQYVMSNLSSMVTADILQLSLFIVQLYSKMLGTQRLRPCMPLSDTEPFKSLPLSLLCSLSIPRADEP